MSSWGTSCIFRGVHSQEQLQPCTDERPKVLSTLLHRSQRVSAAGAGLCHSRAVPFQVRAIPGLCHASWQHRSLGTDTQQLPPAPSSASCRMVGWKLHPFPIVLKFVQGFTALLDRERRWGEGKMQSLSLGNGASGFQSSALALDLGVKPLPVQRCCCAQPLQGSGHSGCWALWGAAARQILSRNTAPRLEKASRSHLRCGTEVKAGENTRALKTQRKFMGGFENPRATKHKI